MLLLEYALSPVKQPVVSAAFPSAKCALALRSSAPPGAASAARAASPRVYTTHSHGCELEPVGWRQLIARQRRDDDGSRRSEGDLGHGRGSALHGALLTARRRQDARAGANRRRGRRAVPRRAGCTVDHPQGGGHRGLVSRHRTRRQLRRRLLGRLLPVLRRGQGEACRGDRPLWHAQSALARSHPRVHRSRGAPACPERPTVASEGRGVPSGPLGQGGGCAGARRPGPTPRTILLPLALQAYRRPRPSSTAPPRRSREGRRT